MTGETSLATRFHNLSNLADFHSREAATHYGKLKKEKAHDRRASLYRDANRHTRIAAEYGLELNRLRAA